jgi:hypothetical protein
MENTIIKVVNNGRTVYKTGKSFWDTVEQLKRYSIIYCYARKKKNPFIRVGKRLHLTAAEELKIVSYLIQMQLIGFGLSGNKIRRYSFQISKNKSKNCFNERKQITGFD